MDLPKIFFSLILVVVWKPTLLACTIYCDTEKQCIGATISGDPMYIRGYKSGANATMSQGEDIYIYGGYAAEFASPIIVKQNLLAYGSHSVCNICLLPNVFCICYHVQSSNKLN